MSRQRVWHAHKAFQLKRLHDDALALMNRAICFGPAALTAPESQAAAMRAVARLARIWGWITARSNNDPIAAARALRGAERNALDRRARPALGGALACDVDELVERAHRLEALYRAEGKFSR